MHNMTPAGGYFYKQCYNRNKLSKFQYLYKLKIIDTA